MELGSKNIALHIDDDNLVYYKPSASLTGEALIMWLRANRVQFGSDSHDVEYEIQGSNGGIKYDAANGALILTTTPIIQSGQSYPLTTVTTLTSGAGYTLTAAQVLGGLISDTTATGAIAAVMPTVAAVVALIPGWVVGTSFDLIYRNPGNQTVTLTTDASTQWTMTGTMTIATLNAKLFRCVIASATTGTVYSIGTFVC